MISDRGLVEVQRNDVLDPWIESADYFFLHNVGTSGTRVLVTKALLRNVILLSIILLSAFI